MVRDLLAHSGVCTYTQVVDATAAAEARVGVDTLPSSTRDDGKPALPPANRFATALCGVLGLSAPDSILVDALLLSHHPLVCHSAKGAASLWGGIKKRAFGGEEKIDRLLRDEPIAAGVTTRLFSAMHEHSLYSR